MEKIKELLNQISKIVVEEKTQQEERRKRGENFNIFNVLGLSSSEVRLHSAFLAELLNPNGDHGLGDKFLQAFLEGVVRKIKEFNHFTFDTTSAKVYVEYDIGQISPDETEGGRIDILLEDKDHQTIIIENKIYAGDQPKQLLRYYNYATKTKKLSYTKKQFALLYLTLFGSAPSNKSIGLGIGANLEYKIISYQYDVLRWMDCSIGIAALHPGIRETISQYIINLKQILGIMNENSNKEILNLLLDKSNVEATLSIWGLATDIGISIRRIFIENRLRKLADSYKMDFFYDKDFPLLPSGNKSYNGIYFKIPNITHSCFKIEQYNNQVYYGIIVCDVEEEKKTIKYQFEDWSDGINKTWPYGSKYFEDKMRWWDIKESLLDMALGNKIVGVVEYELKRILDNHIMEDLNMDFS